MGQLCIMSRGTYTHACLFLWFCPLVKQNWIIESILDREYTVFHPEQHFAFGALTLVPAVTLLSDQTRLGSRSWLPFCRLMSAVLPFSDVAHKPHATMVLLTCPTNISAARILKRPSSARSHAATLQTSTLGNREVASKPGSCWWCTSTSKRRAGNFQSWNALKNSNGCRLPTTHFDFCGPFVRNTRTHTLFVRLWWW